MALLVAAAACAGPGGDSASDAAPGSDSTDPAAREAALTAARSVLDAINESDPDLLRGVMTADALIVSAAPGRPPARSTVDDLASMVADPPRDYTERMWDERVESDGTVASVWAPYDFYRDGELSHCGVDAFHLVRVDDRWRVQSLVYSHLQPSDCETHPEGPPPGSGSSRAGGR